MFYWISVFMSFSVCIAAVIAAVRIRNLDPVYLPFILCIWIGTINELISFVLAQNGYANIANNNIYILIEGILLLWQFKRWKIINSRVFPTLVLLLAGTWFYEIHNLHALQNLHYCYRLLYAAIMVICCINFNNKLIISHANALVTNPGFLISTGYILYFIPKIVADTYWLYNANSSIEFLTAVFWVMATTNLLINLLFITAIIWIPRKPDYITF